MRVLPLLLPFLLWATVNEPLRLSFFSGYRNDRLHWHLQEGGTGTLLESELYRNLQFWENGASLFVIHRDLTFSLEGDYATQFHAHDWAADASSYFAYAVNLTDGRLYQVLLLPLVGFSGHFERLQPLLHSTWYGPFVGAGFQIAPGTPLIFQGGYSYHWLTAHFTTSSFKAKGNGNLGQTGWLQLDYSFAPWRVGAGALVHYFSSTLIPVNQSQKLKVRWTPISCWVNFSREI